MKKIVAIVIIIVVLILLFFIKTNYKLFNFGNNISNKSAEEIEKCILDINSYELVANITIESNKNVNNYVVKEKYIKSSNIFRQDVIEPENIEGLSFIYDGSNLKIENTNLGISKIYENYPYIGENNITLMSFINDYISSNNSKTEDSNNEIILEIKLKNGNKYVCYKKLYIDKETGKPTKLEIQDITQKTTIYILYNEIEINNLQENDILAFKLQEVSKDI